MVVNQSLLNKKPTRKNSIHLQCLKVTRLFEGPSIDMPQRYANVQKTLLFTGFYATLLPIGIVFSFVGLIITYWTDKVKYSNLLIIYKFIVPLVEKTC